MAIIASMQKPNGRVCLKADCTKPLVDSQLKYCSKSHSAHGTRAWSFKDRSGSRLWLCKVCGSRVPPKVSYCSAEHREQAQLQALLAFCVKSGPAIKSATLRRRLIRAGLKTAQCEWCGLTEWREKSGLEAPLQLDHINGDKRDNRLSNLRVLCGNCHMQTDTYCGRNIGRVSRNDLDNSDVLI